jgi:heme exporter protein A
MRLSVDDLGCARGGLPILAGVSFEVPAGEALVLRGRNGAGKTTLLRTLAGLQPRLAGTVEPEPDRIAYAAHADGVKAMLTVRENLLFWARIHGTREIAPALEAFDLVDLADRFAQNLSAGQRRRLGLARLLVTGRPVWALDEPTVSLDAAAEARLLAAIRGHLAAGGSAILATHVDLPLEAETFDLAPCKATFPAPPGFDEAFL